MDQIRVLIVNESQFVCDVMSNALQDEPGINVIASATNVEQALELAAESDVVLVSTKLANNGALDIIRDISQCFEDTKVLAMGLSEKYQNVEAFIESGADGIIHKNDSMDDLVDHIRASAENKALWSSRHWWAMNCQVGLCFVGVSVIVTTSRDTSVKSDPATGEVDRLSACRA